MTPTRFPTLCFPCLVPFTGEDRLGDPTPTATESELQERERSHALNLQRYSIESTVGQEMERVLITHIRVTDVSIKLRCIAVGFYVVVNSQNVNYRTSNKPVPVGRDVVEWDDEVVLPSDRSLRISLTVFALFELGPTLGEGEALCKFESNVGELLDHNGGLELIRLVEQGDGGVSPRTFLGIKIERRVCSRNEYAVPSAPSESLRLWELMDRGHRALIRYRELEEEKDLEESITRFEDARDVCPPDHPSRDTVLFNLATAKLIHCRANDMSPDLDTPINLYRTIIRLRPLDHPDLRLTLLGLAIALKTRCQRQHNKADGKEGQKLLSQVLGISLEDSYACRAAILVLTETAKTVTNDFNDERKVGATFLDFSRHALLNLLPILFYILLNCLVYLVDPEKVSSMLQAVERLTSDHDPQKRSQLNNHGNSLSTRYQYSTDVKLQKALLTLEDAVHLLPDGHPDKLLRLHKLWDWFSTRYERFGDVGDLEKSISVEEDALRSLPDDHPDKPSWLNDHGRSLSDRHVRCGDVADLGKAISKHEDAVRLTPDDHPDKALFIENLGRSLSNRYERFGDVADLEKAISLSEEAVRLTPDDHSDRPSQLNNLGLYLSTRYARFGDVADLESSISKHTDVVRLTPDDDPYKPLWLNNLGSSLLTRYKRFGDLVDLEKSISTREDAVRLTPDGHSDKPLYLDNLSRSFFAHYKRFGDLVALEKSISTAEDAVRLTPGGHPDEPLRLNNLGLSHSARYARFGDVVDLQKSISRHEDAVQLTPDDHPSKPVRLSNLGLSLATRYKRFGDVADLEKSISTREDAVRLTPDGHTQKPLWLNNLSRALSLRYKRFGDIVDLEKSISMEEDAVQLTPDGHLGKPARLNNLGRSLSTRYQRLGDVIDLERSISRLEDAVRLTPDDHPRKPLWLDNLGGSFLIRYKHFGDGVDLEKAISMKEDAVLLTPDGHPYKSLFLNSLAASLLDRFQRSGDPASSDLPKVILHASRAARSHAGLSHHRFRASLLWIKCVRLSQHDSQSLLDPYMVALDLLPQLAWIGLPLDGRYDELYRAARIACDAATAALEADRADLAVEWLEQGRSIVWNQLSQLRTPVDDLRIVHPELAVQFEHISHQLEHATTRDRATLDEVMNESDIKNESLEKEAQQHHALALSRESLLAQIRALPGFDRFLLPKTIDQLASLAHEGPVVFLNASEHGCDALVVIPGSERVVHVPLSNTSFDEVAGMQLRLKKLLQINGRVVLRDDSDRGARIQGMNANEVFSSILPYLWDNVVNPVLEVLAFSTSAQKLSRVFWCPTGPFTFLPIHAAGRYGTDDSGPKLSDFAISSYIPSMSALELPPQVDSEATSDNVRLLAVPQPSTDGQAPLTGVKEEIKVIKQMTSSSPFVGFEKADGTVEDVVAKMKKSDWVHFACHGTQDRANPLDSGLVLADGRRLKVSDIVRLSRPHGGLAFLSACQTATGDEDLSEEAIHIAAGMLLAGYRGVIATMWTIMDSDAPRVTEDVYKHLFRDGKVPDSREAAEALHGAIERLRKSGAPFLSWVPFIHVGL